MMRNPNPSSKNGDPTPPPPTGSRRFIRPAMPMNTMSSFGIPPSVQMHYYQQQQCLSSHPSMPGAPFQFYGNPPISAYYPMPMNCGQLRGNGFPVHPILPAYNGGYPAHLGLPPYNPHPSSSRLNLQQYSLNGSPYPQPWGGRQNVPQQYPPLPFVTQHNTYADDTPSSSTEQPSRKRPASPFGNSFAPNRPFDVSTSFMIDGKTFDIADCPIIEKKAIRQNQSMSTADDAPSSFSASKHLQKTDKGETEPNPSDDDADNDGVDLVINQAVLDSIFNHPEAIKKSFTPDAMKELKLSVASMMEDYIGEAIAKAEARYEYEQSDEAIEAAGQFNFMMKYYAALDRKARKEKNPSEAEGQSSAATDPSMKDPSLSAVDNMQPRATDAQELDVEKPVEDSRTVTYRDVCDVLWDDPVLHNTPLGELVLLLRPNDIHAEIERLEAEAEMLAREQMETE